MPKGNQYDYLLEEIKVDLQKMHSFSKNYSFFISSRKYNIYMVYPHTISSKINPTRIFQLFDKYIQKIYVWLFIANQYASPTCSENLSIYIYMTNHKKRLPKRKLEPLSRTNCNSAYTMTCTPEGTENEIYIFRKEEWFKILTHELFHALGFDYSGIVDENLNHSINEIFPLHIDLKIYEAYCEFWADLLNSVFASFYGGKTSVSNLLKKTFSGSLK